MNDLREKVIEQVAMARLVNEEVERMRRLKLTDEELKNILYYELAEKESTFVKPHEIDEISPLKISIASKLLLEKWSSLYTETSFKTINDHIVNTPEGDSFTIVVERQKRGLKKLFSRTVNETENLNFIVTKTIKDRVVNQVGGEESPVPSEYVSRCLAKNYAEEPENRTWQSDKRFNSVLTPLNSWRQ